MKVALLVVSLFLQVEPKSLNFLFIVVDDLRPALGAYGDPNAFTPNLDALGEESVVYLNTYAQQALCGPSRNSFLTSRRPDTLNLYDVHSYWRASAGNYTTLPQHLKESGYQTASIGKVFHPGITSNSSDDQPYSWTEPPFHPSTIKFKNSPVCQGGRVSIVCPVRVQDQPEGTLPDIQSSRAAREFLRRAREPFFLAVGFHKPHIPLKYPSVYDEFHPLEKVKLPGVRTRPRGLPQVAWAPWNDLRWRDDIKGLNVSFPFGEIPEDYARRIVRSYNAAVTYVDYLIGGLLQELKNTGLYDSTAVLVFGDHGWSLGEHGEWSKYSNYEAAVRVPFILRVPGWKAEKNRALVELVDIFPTVVDLASLPSLPYCESKDTQLCTEGRSLVKETRMQQMAWSQYPRPGLVPTARPDSDQPRLRDIKVMGYSIRCRRFRYTEWVAFKGLRPLWSQVYARELYDHTLDPDENNNLIEEFFEKKIYFTDQNCTPKKKLDKIEKITFNRT